MSSIQYRVPGPNISKLLSIFQPSGLTTHHSPLFAILIPETKTKENGSWQAGRSRHAIGSYLSISAGVGRPPPSPTTTPPSSPPGSPAAPPPKPPPPTGKCSGPRSHREVVIVVIVVFIIGMFFVDVQPTYKSVQNSSRRHSATGTSPALVRPRCPADKQRDRTVLTASNLRTERRREAERTFQQQVESPCTSRVSQSKRDKQRHLLQGN
jgi:hypothetical protein